MKKALIILAATAMFAMNAKADINVSWFGSLGFYNWDVVGAPVDPNDYINFGGGTATAYLFYSTDNVASPDQGNLGGNLASGNDTQIDSFVNNSAPYGDYANGTELYAGFGAGFVFLRIIDLSAPGGAIAQYYDSAPVAVPAFDPALPLVVSVDHNAGSGAAGSQMLAVVPEPSTFVLAGIGAILVAARRRFAKA